MSSSARVRARRRSPSPLRAHPGLKVRVLLDERSAGFFALGLARASRRPVAVVVTSGTAVANLLPAVVEASLARVPLVLLTADRPPELRERGAPQTIDQVGIFGVHVRWSVDLPLLDGAAGDAAARAVGVGRAVATARGGPAGPVHLNIAVPRAARPVGRLGPARPRTTRATRGRSRRGRRRAARPRAVGASRTWPRAWRRRSAGSSSPGPQDDPALPAALARLAAATGFPIVADPLSGVRCGPHDRTFVLATRTTSSARAVARRPRARPRRPVRGDDDLEADADAARDRARRPRSSSTATAAGATRRSSRRRSSRPMPTATADALADALAGRPRGRSHGWARDWCEADRAADRALATGWRRRGARRAVRGAAVRRPGRVAPRRGAAVGRQQHAGPRHRRLAAERPRGPSGRCRTAAPTASMASSRPRSAPPRPVSGRWRSSSATCRSCTT